MKKCTKCKEWKPKSEFYKRKKGKEGLSAICKICSQKRDKKYCQKYKKWLTEQRREYAREWFQKNKRRIKEQTRNNYCLRKYSMNWEQKLQMLEDQDGLCAICCRPLLPEEACVDHDHGIGIVRGILCQDCNRGLGTFRDSRFVMERAINYLKKNRDLQCP